MYYYILYDSIIFARQMYIRIKRSKRVRILGWNDPRKRLLDYRTPSDWLVPRPPLTPGSDVGVLMWPLDIKNNGMGGFGEEKVHRERKRNAKKQGIPRTSPRMAYFNGWMTPRSVTGRSSDYPGISSCFLILNRTLFYHDVIRIVFFFICVFYFISFYFTGDFFLRWI